MHLAQVILLPDTSGSAGPGSTGLGQGEKCARWFKLRQRDLQCEEVSMLPISSCLSREEGGGRVGNPRLSHMTLGSTESLRQRILPKCKR